MKQTIFTVYVLMQSQSDCDEAKRICEEYGLPYIEKYFEFWNILKYNNAFGCYTTSDKFCVHVASKREKTEVSLTRFKELCEEYKLNK